MIRLIMMIIINDSDDDIHNCDGDYDDGIDSDIDHVDCHDDDTGDYYFDFVILMISILISFSELSQYVLPDSGTC